MDPMKPCEPDGCGAPPREPLLCEEDVRHIVRILGKVAAMKPDPDKQRTFLMNELAALLGTDTWAWAVAPLLDPAKQPVFLYQNTSGFDDLRMSRFLTAVEHPDCAKIISPLVSAMVSEDSQVTRHMERIVTRERFANSPAKPLWDAAGIGPIQITLHPVPGYGISCIGIYRPVGAPMFTERETRIAHILLSEVPLLHEAGMPHSVARPILQLPPRCRLIINLLVRGQTRKDIASHLGISVHTVSVHVKKIFHHFSVHSQSELIARLSHGDGRDR